MGHYLIMKMPTACIMNPSWSYLVLTLLSIFWALKGMARSRQRSVFNVLTLSFWLKIRGNICIILFWFVIGCVHVSAWQVTSFKRPLVLEMEMMLLLLSVQRYLCIIVLVVALHNISWWSAGLINVVLMLVVLPCMPLPLFTVIVLLIRWCSSSKVD